MESLLLSIHVVAGILFVGPVAVATSLFPRYAPAATVAAAAVPIGPRRRKPRSKPRKSERSVAVARVLQRITRVYGTLALMVPAVGIALAAVQGRLGEVWVVTAMVLTAIAGGLLALLIAPLQQEALDTPDNRSQLGQLGMLTGVFNLLWFAVVVLMIVRPGSSYT